MTFQEAVRLRETIVAAANWPTDLISVEAYGMDISRGGTPRGYRVVLAWTSDGGERIERVIGLSEAQAIWGKYGVPPRQEGSWGRLDSEARKRGRMVKSGGKTGS